MKKEREKKRKDTKYITKITIYVTTVKSSDNKTYLRKNFPHHSELLKNREAKIEEKKKKKERKKEKKQEEKHCALKRKERKKKKKKQRALFHLL